jgi:hypothetical protein
MTIEQKSALIFRIISKMKFEAENENKRMRERDFSFDPAKQKFVDEGDMFFSLAFKSDDELKKIAKLANA